MGLYKYKLRENEIGSVETDQGIKTTVTDVNPEFNSIEWKVEYDTDLGSPIGKLNAVVDALKGIIRNYEEDKYFHTLLDYTKKLRNSYRSHIRDEYPEEYKLVKSKKEYMRESEDIDEESTSAGVGGYSTPFAFNKNKNAKGAASAKYYYKLGFKKVPAKIKGSGLEVKYFK